MNQLIEATDAFLVEVALAKYEADLARIENSLQAIVKLLFRKQGRLFVAALRKLRGSWPIQEAADFAPELMAAWADISQASVQVAAALEAPIRQAVAQGIRAEVLAQAEREFERTFAVAHPRAVAYAEGYGARLVTQIDEETRRQINGIVSKAIDTGQGYRATERQIRVRFEEFAEPKPQKHILSRARLVARTESAMAYSAGQQVVVDEMRDAGLNMEKHWLTSRDTRVSAGCSTNGSAGWIPERQAFPSGHMRHPRFPGCRCTTQYRVAN